MTIAGSSLGEPVAPSIYHIHLDGTHLPKELDQYIQSSLGFRISDFQGHPEGYRHFEPQHHRVLKVLDGRAFKRIWEDVEDRAHHAGFIGYLEGEYIRSDVRVEEHPFDPTVQIPFKIQRRVLRGPEYDEPFRETEVHLTMDRDASHPQLIDVCLQAGLYGAYIPKIDHTALVLTMQGHERNIRPLTQCLASFLARAGGVVRGTLKEERAIRYAMFGMTHEGLPEIADQVHYTL
ncbi:MAG: hypothetical protein RL141_581 [Candidatus Parcubacteria bacterium]